MDISLNITVPDDADQGEIVEALLGAAEALVAVHNHHLIKNYWAPMPAMSVDSEIDIGGDEPRYSRATLNRSE